MNYTNSLRELLSIMAEGRDPRPQPGPEQLDILVQAKLWLTLDEIAHYIDQTQDLAVKAQWMQIFLTEWQRQCNLHAQD
jgi:hypothetical protein